MLAEVMGSLPVLAEVSAFSTVSLSEKSPEQVRFMPISAADFRGHAAVGADDTPYPYPSMPPLEQ